MLDTAADPAETVVRLANVHVLGFDRARLRAAVPEWDGLPRAARHAHLNRGTVAPHRETHTHNVACEGLFGYIAHALTLSQSEGSDLAGPGRLALGDDASAFDSSDTSLNNRVGDIAITDPVAQGPTFRINEFLSSNELNGETIRELGIESSDGTLWNHSATDEAWSKTQNLALLFEVEITISTA